MPEQLILHSHQPELAIQTEKAHLVFGSLLVDEEMKALNLRAETEHLLNPATQRSALLQHTEIRQTSVHLNREKWSNKTETEQEKTKRLRLNELEFSEIHQMGPERLQNRAEIAARENEGLADIYDYKASRTVGVIRKELSLFSTDQQKYLDALLDANSEFSPFLKSLNPINNLSWASWLSRTPAEGGASDEQVRNVIQWHTDYIDRMNGGYDGVDHLEEAFRSSRDSYIRAAEAGLLPTAIITRLQEAKQEEIVYEDLFGLATDLSYGYAFLESQAIHLPGPEQIKVKLHEFSHGYIGTMYPGKEKIAGKRWLDEALTEIIASIAETGVAGAIYEPDDGKFYPTERKLLASILNSPDCPLTLDGLIQIYCSGTVEEKAEVFTTIDTILEDYLLGDKFSLKQRIETLGLDPSYNGDENQYLDDLAFVLDDMVRRRANKAARNDFALAGP